MAYGDVPAVAGILYGIKPAVVAIVLHAAWRIGSRALKRPVLWVDRRARRSSRSSRSRCRFPRSCCAAAIIGCVGGRVAPREFAIGGAATARGGATHAPAVIDDDDADARARAVPLVAARARWSWCASPCGRVALGRARRALRDWTRRCAQMGWFFTQGRAADVRRRVRGAALRLSGRGRNLRLARRPTQMIDGLALGETTPGPLIMVVAFVGFVGGWTKTAVRPAIAVRWRASQARAWRRSSRSCRRSCSSSPAGRWSRSTHGQLRFTAPLTGITAAVVGVIVNLAVFFAWHVFWPQRLDEPVHLTGGLDALSLAIGIAAGVALFRFKASVDRR